LQRIFKFDNLNRDMPITKSAKKALRQSLKRRITNLRRKRKIKDLTKKIKVLISQKKIEEAKMLLPQIYKAIDKAAKTGVIKENKATRKKSQIARLVNKLSVE